jgi:hypothetical protein
MGQWQVVLQMNVFICESASHLLLVEMETKKEQRDKKDCNTFFISRAKVTTQNS